MVVLGRIRSCPEVEVRRGVSWVQIFSFCCGFVFRFGCGSFDGGVDVDF